MQSSSYYSHTGEAEGREINEPEDSVKNVSLPLYHLQ